MQARVAPKAIVAALVAVAALLPLEASLAREPEASTRAATSPEPEQISFDVAGPRPSRLTAYLFRAPGPRPAPLVVGLHGCAGLLSRAGVVAERETDWARRFVAAGYHVLLPDSFTDRGYREICTRRDAERPIRPRHRAIDAATAVAWAATQTDVDPARIALIGWSNGGSSVLWAAAEPTVAAAPSAKPAVRPVTAIAFYPGCRVPAERADWRPAMPLAIFIGDADDWTPPEPCRALAARFPIALTEYPGAVHGFDAPDSPRRTRTGVGLSARGDGRVETGTDPVARAAAIEAVMAILAKAFAVPSPR